MVYFLLIILFVWLIALNIKVSELSNKLDEVSSSLSRRLSHLQFEQKNIANTKPQPIKSEEQPQKVFEENNEEQYTDEIPYSVTEETANNSSVNNDDEIKVENREYSYEDSEKTILNKKADFNKPVEDKGFEQVFFGNVYAIVGAIAVILRFGFFALVVASILSPMAKVIIGLIAGIFIILLGVKPKKESLKRFSEVLIGTGFSVLFITTYSAAVFSKVISAQAGIILGCIILVSAYIMADKQKTTSMISIAMFGGYFNLMLLWSDLSFGFLFSYLIFLNILSIIFVLRNQDKDRINIINLLLTLCISIIFVSLNNDIIKDFDIIYPSILCIAYLAYDIHLRLTKDNYDSIGILNWLNYAVITILSILIFKYDRMEIGLFQLCTASAGGISACIFMVKSSDKFRVYLRTMLFSIFLVIAFTTEGSLRIGILSLGAIILSYVSSTYNRQYLAKWALGYYCSAIIFIFVMNKDMFYLVEEYRPIMNTRTLSFIAPILAGFVSYTILNKMTDVNCKKMAELMKFSCLSLIYILITFELGDFIRNSHSLEESAHFISFMTYAIIGCIYSVNMRKLGQITGNSLYQIPSYLIGIAAIIILLSGGLDYVPEESFIPVINIRFIAYLIAIGYALYMAKDSRKEESDIFKYLAVFLGFILITVETRDYIDKINNDTLFYLISVAWLIYASIITAVGLIKDKKYLKVSGIIITTLAVLKIVIIDMAHVELLLRMFVFILLGIILLVISWYYNSKQK